MKMEHTPIAPFDGVVTHVFVAAGAQVLVRQTLLTVALGDSEQLIA